MLKHLKSYLSGLLASSFRSRPSARRASRAALAPGFGLGVVLGVVACTATVGGPDGEGDGSDASGGKSAVATGGSVSSFGDDGGGFAGRPAFPGTGPSDDDGSGGAAPADCRRPEGSRLAARRAVMEDGAGAARKVVFTRDVFSQFQSYCGGCHVDAALGGFEEQRVTFENFSELVTEDAILLMQSDDLDEVMPKPVAGGKAWSSRPEGDPIRSFAALLQSWMDAGRPKDLFFVEVAGQESKSPYVMSPEEGESLTNIGNCVAEREVFATDTEVMEDLDEKFRSMTSLPDRLSETDLSTLDGLTLASRGLFAVAPAYPLWSDGSGKLRQVRLPRGTALRYNQDTNEFDVPENTRVYKTFFKTVVERDGREAHRKIETRLIVARQDACSAAGCEVRALFGTYAWNDDETEAFLVRDPNRDGSEFRDRVITYVTDEAKAEAAGTDPVALAAATRHYAIPGAERCVQCHMGSPTKNFLAGISPIQLNRVPYVEEPDDFASGDELVGDGILEEDIPTADELEQFESLIDLGVITGIESAALLPRLKELGPAPPRNNFELRAQGYLLGNCALCHNPRGFPSVKLPELRDLLNFYPNAEGGIFQFPLERYSPRVKRGSQAELAVPYISPSSFDMRYADASASESELLEFRSMCFPRQVDGQNLIGCVPAPWRSLIYRNVDTPFTYADDSAIYPRMPRHTAGFDCRAPHLMAEWMLSIPSKLKGGATKAYEYKMPDSQPREEVRMLVPTDKAVFNLAKAEAKSRLETYRQGERYSYCPDTSDILDPEILEGLTTAPRDKGQFLPGNPYLKWYDAVPDHAHFAPTDKTEVPGDWTPRRADWPDILLAEDPAKIAALSEDDQRIVAALSTDDLSISEEFREYALAPQRVGLWKAEPSGACDAAYSKLPKLSSSATDNPYWADPLRLDFSLPVYEVSPGAAVFGLICRNCHGPDASGNSALADTILDITGGAGRVANLRGGLFGPDSAPGDNRSRVFSELSAAAQVPTEELAARYMLWMALGGTEVQIPTAALKIVQNTQFLGQKRYGDTLPSANMLANAVEICRATLPAGKLFSSQIRSRTQLLEDLYAESVSSVRYDLLNGMAMSSWSRETPLIRTNGDAELWVDLCASRQRSPVRGLVLRQQDGSLTFDQDPYVAPELTQQAEVAIGTEVSGRMYRLYDPDSYGTRPLMTPAGRSLGVPEGESQVWCLEPAQTELGRERMNEWAAAHPVDGEPYPICPEDAATWGFEEQRLFAIRGAMAAGLAVYAYLDAVGRGMLEPALQYDECRKLGVQ